MCYVELLWSWLYASWFEILRGFSWLPGLYGLKFENLIVSAIVFLYLCSYKLVGYVTETAGLFQTQWAWDETKLERLIVLFTQTDSSLPLHLQFQQDWIDYPTNTIGTWTGRVQHHMSTSNPHGHGFSKDYTALFKACNLQKCKWYHIVDHEYSVTTATCKHALHDLHGTIYHSTSASCKPRNHCCIV